MSPAAAVHGRPLPPPGLPPLTARTPHKASQTWQPDARVKTPKTEDSSEGSSESERKKVRDSPALNEHLRPMTVQPRVINRWHRAFSQTFKNDQQRHIVSLSFTFLDLNAREREREKEQVSEYLPPVKCRAEQLEEVVRPVGRHGTEARHNRKPEDQDGQPGGPAIRHLLCMSVFE